MVPSGPPTPIAGGPSITPSLLRSNSGMLGGQGAFPSLGLPRAQSNSGNLMGNNPNVSSLLNPSFGNGSGQNGLRGGAEADPFSGFGNGMEFNSQFAFGAANMGNSSLSSQGQQFPSTSGNHMLLDQSQSQQSDSQNFQHPRQQSLQQFSVNQQPQSQLYQSIRGGLSGGALIKLEPQVTGDQHGVPQQQSSLRGLGQIKLEQQQMQSMRGIGSIKMDPQNPDQSLFLQQQQQHHQQLLQQISTPRQSSQAATAVQLNLLQQQRILHLQQQQQQQQLMKSMPQQRSQLQSQNLPFRSPVKSVYEPGMCAQRLTHYMYQQQHRPEDNSIEFWRKFVAEYFAPNAKKKWCVSMYGSGRQTNGVFPQDVWHCEICKRKPGRGFEATVEVLPRLFKIKYESGTLEELLYVDMPREYQNSSGQIVLDYAKAIQESVFEQLRVVRDGQLRIVFSLDLKICSWEFCARRHEELIPRRLLIPQVSQLGTTAQKYQASAQNSSPNTPVSDIQSNCNMFVASARQLAKTLEVPLVNDLGYTKRYVRCLQISEVVNSMKDLIDHSRLTGAGPMESLAKFPRRTGTPTTLQGQNQQPEEQQHNSNNNDDGSSRAGAMQAPLTNGPSPSSTSHSTIVGLVHQNSMNSRNQNPMSNTISPYGGGSSVLMPSPSSSNTILPSQPNSSLFQSPTPSTSHGNMAGPISDGDNNDSQSSIQKLIQGMVMNNQPNGGVNMSNCPVGNSPTNSNSSIGYGAFGGMSQATMDNGLRATMGNNSMNGRVGIPSMGHDQSMNHRQQYDLGNQMLNGLGSVNSFNGLQFDWKPSP